MFISGADVARLLRSTDPAPVLVVVGGGAAVVDRAQLDGERYRGAFMVAERDELLEGKDPGELSEEEIDAIARRLDSSVSHLGG